PAQGRLRLGAMLVRRPLPRCDRGLHPSALVVVAGFGRDRRHRSWPRLHLAGVDAGEVVPGPPRHGDRHGHHGFRRRRHDRRSAGLLSLFNIGGRFFWASLSDKIGRKNTYYTFFILGIVLYALAPTFAAMGSKLLFVLGFGIILSMYGGGFATVPAYLADMFGT